MQANRNGFFYVLDRTDGKFLLGTQYVKNVTWATRPHAEGPADRRARTWSRRSKGKRVCPSLDGASNWYSTSFNPATGLYYVQTNDKCGIFTQDADGVGGRQGLHGRLVQAGARRAGAARPARDRHPDRAKSSWELPQTGAVDSWGGVLSTAGGVVIFGEDSGALMAADAATGKPLWSFQTSQLWKASPMTYMFDNKQYVAVAAGSEHHRVRALARFHNDVVSGSFLPSEQPARRPRRLPEQNPRGDCRVRRVGEHAIDPHAEELQVLLVGCSP